MRRGAVLLIGSSVVYALCQWGVVAAFAKLGSVDAVGMYALALAVCGPVFVFSNLHLKTIVATNALDEFDVCVFRRLRTITACLALCVVAGVGVAAGYSRYVVAVLFVVALTKAIESQTDLRYGLWQRDGNMHAVAASQIIRGSAGVASAVIGMYITGDLLTALVLLGASWAAVSITFDRTTPIRWPLRHRAQIPLPHLANLARRAAPAGLVAVTASLVPNVPRYALESAHGVAELGYYAAAAYFLVGGLGIVSALGQAASPLLGRYRKNGDISAFRALGIRLVVASGGVGVCGWAAVAIFGPDILTILYGSDYAAYADVLELVMVAAALSYVASANWFCLTALGAFNQQVVVFAGSLVVTIVVSLLLVKEMAALGAAIALTAGMGVQAIATTSALWLRIRRGCSQSNDTQCGPPAEFSGKTLTR
jgi:O-antigen/teichoic acid export membrane protein